MAQLQALVLLSGLLTGQMHGDRILCQTVWGTLLHSYLFLQTGVVEG